MKLVLKIKVISILLLSMLLVNCNDWLDVEPVGVQTSTSFWQTKEEVEGVLMSSYLQLRRSMDHMFMWGELRGSGLEFGSGFTGGGAEADQEAIRELNILPTNMYADYTEMYKGISYANFVIKLGPGAMKYDVTLTEPLMNSYLAEAVFLRSLYYFYLVKTFRDVPYIKTAYDTDAENFKVGKTSGDTILRDVLVDLKKYAVMCKPGYEVTWQGKGRATSWAYYALIADISLWIGDYDTAIEYCNKVKDGPFVLSEMDDWMEIYFPGNSDESIFELQYNHSEENQRNSLYDLTNGNKFIVSEYLDNLFVNISNRDIDVRGYGWGYLGKDNKVWKYIGVATNISSNEGAIRPDALRSPNFIFYRYADIIFIEAEALIMQSSANIDAALTLLDNTIRERAGYRSKLGGGGTSSQAEAIKTLMNERLKEFYGEGKSWYDMLRASRVEGVGIKYLQEILLPYVPSNQREIRNNELNNRDSHYLPLHEKEIKAAGTILVQNPFYKKYTDNI